MKRRFINTVEAAVRFFHILEMEVIETDGGLILHGISFSNDDFELTCDSEAELIEVARCVRDQLVNSSEKSGADLFFSVRGGESLSQADGLRARSTDSVLGVQPVKNKTEVSTK